MDENLTREMGEFITQRMDDLGTDAPDYIAEVITTAGCCMDILEKTLSEQQLPLWHDMEDALSRQTGEETRYYYQAGFRDGVHFLLEWGAGV